MEARERLEPRLFPPLPEVRLVVAEPLAMASTVTARLVSSHLPLAARAKHLLRTFLGCQIELSTSWDSKALNHGQRVAQSQILGDL